MIKLATAATRALSSRRTRALTAFHPETRSVARYLPRGGIPLALAPLAQKLGSYQPARSDATEHAINSAASIRLHRPAGIAQPQAALLWVHGGGLILGTPKQDDAICRRIADQLGILVGAVKYRLAPGHQYPAALDDCYEGLRWLRAQAGIDPTRVAIGGASAGGGLAAAVALRMRDVGDLPVALQLLLYPMLDDRTGLRSDLDDIPTRLWNNKANRLGWSSYLGHPVGIDGVSPLAVPARARDLARVAPAWIGVGTADLFYNEDVEYAKRLRDCGVDCTLEVVEGGYHAFDVMCPKASVSRDFVTAQIEALRRALK